MRARKVQETIQTYLISIGSIYLFAFASLYVQVPGLYGENGLLPIKNILPKLNGNLTISDHAEALKEFPSIIMYHDIIGLPPGHMMEFLCLTGILLSTGVMIFTVMRSSLVFLFLWILYLSLVKVGQTFLHFQWDTLLLETGIITVIVAPFNAQFWKRPVARPHDASSLWLIRWLLFRLMFASGVVKLTSLCPTWWGLTALNWHYESQCIPTPLSWYAHQLPEWFQKLNVVGTYYIEILVPFLFFVPVRSLRLFSFVCQVFFQLCIILTGNYNFFNLLTIVLCLSLLDDDCLTNRKKKKVSLDWTRTSVNSVCGKRFGKWVHASVRFIVFIVGIVVLGAICWHYFGLRIEEYRIISETSFTKDEFHLAVSYAVPAAAVVGGVSLSLELLYAVWDSLSMPGFLNKLWSLLQTVVMGGAIAGLFSISLVSHSALDRSSFELPDEILNLYQVVNPYSFTSPYGLFRRMTGVGGRPELIIEGSDSVDGPWKEYNFLYKPGDVTASPPYVFPHQPRLDWQMWFAALGHHYHNPWLVNLVHKLLQGQEEVMELLAPPPFPKPPHFIRVGLYTYHYTSYNDSQPFFDQSSSWWYREYKSEYLFTLSLDHKGLIDFLKQNGFTSKPSSEYEQNRLHILLDYIRKYSRMVQPHELLWMLFFTISIISITMTYVWQMFRITRRKESSANTFTNSTSNSTTVATGKGKKKKSNIKKRNANKNEEK